jgi:hypothetical protein
MSKHRRHVITMTVYGDSQPQDFVAASHAISGMLGGDGAILAGKEMPWPTASPPASTGRHAYHADGRAIKHRRVAHRVLNIVIGRSLGRGGFWRFLWGNGR